LTPYERCRRDADLARCAIEAKSRRRHWIEHQIHPLSGGVTPPLLLSREPPTLCAPPPVPVPQNGGILRRSTRRRAPPPLPPATPNGPSTVGFELPDLPSPVPVDPVPSTPDPAPPPPASPIPVPEGVSSSSEGASAASPISSPEGEGVSDQSDLPLRRSSRGRVPSRNSKIFGDDWVTLAHYSVDPDLAASANQYGLTSMSDDSLQLADWSSLVALLRTEQPSSIDAWLSQQVDYDSLSLEDWHPLALMMKPPAADTPRWKEAMHGPLREGFLKAMEVEHQTLVKMKVWEVVDQKPWMTVIPGIWAFRIKRFPDGLIKKLKARFCAQGQHQVDGANVFETYSPVVNWTTVRLMFILSLLLDLETKQVDYRAAFVQSEIDKHPDWDKMSEADRLKSGVYLEMTARYKQHGKVLKLKKSIYGLRQSPRNWFNHHKQALENCGFVASAHDPCLFISDDVIAISFVDDCLFFAPDASSIDAKIAMIRAQDMELDVEDDAAGFLGVDIARCDDGTIEMTQNGLIERIIETAGIAADRVKYTPSQFGALGSEEDGEPAHGDFSYPSLIGQLQYLQGHTRPDITHAVSSCARFTANPKRSHELAILRIVQYLNSTKDRGLCFSPDI